MHFVSSMQVFSRFDLENPEVIRRFVLRDRITDVLFLCAIFPLDELELYPVCKPYGEPLTKLKND